jgi:hypothetical protein
MVKQTAPGDDPGAVKKLLLSINKKRHLLIYLWNKRLAALKPTLFEVRFDK